MKKIIALLLCAVLLCSYAVPALAVANVTFTMVADKTTVQRGDKVELVFTVASTDVVDSFGLRLHYDKNVFEIVDGMNDTMIHYRKDFAISDFSITEGNFASSFKNDVAPNMEFGYVTLRVKDTAPIGTSSFTVTASANLDGVAQNASCNSITFNVTCEHSWGAWGQGDATNHSRNCPKCGGTDTAAHSWGTGNVTKPATCKETGVKTYTCSVCGRTKTETLPKTDDHVFGSWSKVDDNNHKRTCTICTTEVETKTHNWNAGEVTKPATCKETGVKTYTCSDCKGTKTETLPKTDDHVFGSWTKVDDNNHKRTCTVCTTEVETKAHNWNAGEITTEPNCKDPGVKTYTCATCTGTKTESVSSTGDHGYGPWEKISDTEHKRVCTGCGVAFETASHSWNSGEITKPATCKETGVKTYTCSDCKGTKTETLPKTDDHVFGSWTKVDDNNHKRTCTICTTEVETKTHDWNAGEITKDPTCKETGVKTYTCGTCTGTKTETVAKTDDHTFGNWSKVDGTNHKRTCTVCEVASETTTHTWNAGTVTKPATCKEAGEKTFVCTGCGATRTEAINKTNTHSYGNWVKVDAENHKHTCTVCGVASETEAHTMNNGAVTKPATCKEEGVKTFTCTGCGHTATESLPRLTEHTYDHDCDTDCNICGVTRTTEHKYGDKLSYDKDQHYYACTSCGNKKDAAAHIPGPEATEKTAQTCTTCGYIIKPAKGHKHNYSTTKLNSDATGHWYMCAGCNERKDFKPHDFANDCDTICETCQYTRTTEHKFGEEWSSDANGHFHACTICGEKKDTAEHAPGVEATETTAQTCTACGYEIVAALGHAHVYGEVWEKGELKHWKTCACGEKGDEADHVWSEDGSICTVCLAEQVVEEEEPEQTAGGSNLGLIIAVIAAVVVIGGVAVVVLMKKKKAA